MNDYPLTVEEYESAEEVSEDVEVEQSGWEDLGWSSQFSFNRRR